MRSQQLVQDGVQSLLLQPNLSIRQRQSALRFVDARGQGLQRLAELVPAEEDIQRGKILPLAA